MNTPQRQMLLDLKPEQVPSLDNFVAGANVELVERLRGLADARSFEAIYLWGGQGCGKSHLLAATAESARAQRPVVRLAGAEAGAELQLAPGCLLVIDDVGQLGVEAQVALFRAFNSARLAGLALLLSGTAPPLELQLREDLRTRIGQAIVYQVKPLSDEEKAATLQSQASQRGLRVDDEVIGYMLRHTPRDLPSLMAVLDELDRASLERKRPVTVPLLKEMLNNFNRTPKSS